MATVAQPLPESAQSGRQELRLEAAEASAPGRIRSSAEAPIGPDRDDPYVAHMAVVSAELSAHVEPLQRISLADWDALIDIGHRINERLLTSQLEACQCAPDATTLERVVLPSTHDGLPAPGLRFGEPRTMALLACVCSYQHLFAGITNRSLRELIAGLIPGYGARQMTYDLRRLRHKGFIQRIPRSQRYELTSEGYRLVVFFTKTYTRTVNPTLAELDPALPAETANRSAIARAWRAYEHQLDARTTDAALTT